MNAIRYDRDCLKVAILENVKIKVASNVMLQFQVQVVSLGK